MSRIKNVMLVAPKSTGGNFEYVAIPRQGLLYISGALKQWQGDFLYEREVWYEDRNGSLDPAKDLDNVNILLVTALINEAPRAYEIARKAKELHPSLKVVGGGPHMSPLAEEALTYGKLDVVVIREGEDVVGRLCDVLLKYKGADLTRELYKVPGIAFLDEGKVAHTERKGMITSDFVELPDFDAVRDLTPQNPLAAGVIETVRGCTEKCTYCQVIQQFLGYRMISRETELRRLAQIQKLAEDGKIYSAKDGRFSVFISDDLHPPPLRAVKFRDERLARLKGWKGHTDGMWMICQTRAEVGEDPELAQAMRDAGIEMLYVGVESSSAENLKAVRKRQDPSQVHRDLVALNQTGFIVAAMTIIGLPYDTENGIMEMADWVKTVSRYQTANWLTPLPATVNWNGLVPLDEDGSILPQGKMRPYHLYTGKQFVHHDKRWGMQESRDIYAKYMGRLHPVDKMYERIFRMFRSNAYYEVMEDRREETVQPVRVSGHSPAMVEPRLDQLEEKVFTAIRQAKEAVLSSLNDLRTTVASRSSQVRSNAPVGSRTGDIRSMVSVRIGELQESLASRMEEINSSLSGRIKETRTSLTSATGEIRGTISSRVDEMGKVAALKVGELRSSAVGRMAELRETVGSRMGDGEDTFGSRMSEVSDAVSSRLNELGESIVATTNEFRSRWEASSAPARPKASPSH